MGIKCINLLFLNVCFVYETIDLFQCISLLVGHGLLPRSLDLLSSDQSMRIVFNTLEGNYALCLLANLVQMAYIEKDGVLKDVYFPTFTVRLCFIVIIVYWFNGFLQLCKIHFN